MLLPLIGTVYCLWGANVLKTKSLIKRRMHLSTLVQLRCIVLKKFEHYRVKETTDFAFSFLKLLFLSLEAEVCVCCILFDMIPVRAVRLASEI